MFKSGTNGEAKDSKRPFWKRFGRSSRRKDSTGDSSGEIHRINDITNREKPLSPNRTTFDAMSYIVALNHNGKHGSWPCFQISQISGSWTTMTRATKTTGVEEFASYAHDMVTGGVTKEGGMTKGDTKGGVKETKKNSPVVLRKQLKDKRKKML